MYNAQTALPAKDVIFWLWVSTFERFHSLSNWIWLKHLAEALNQEYRYRFHHEKNHKSYDVIMTLSTPPIADLGLTEMPQVMPEEYKDKNPVIAYRQYFIARKFHLAKWTERDVPQWFKKYCHII